MYQFTLRNGGLKEILKQNFHFPYHSIDRTFKLYYGGKQARPDANYSRSVLNKDSQVIAQVAESNRKDVRNAVEVASKALPGLVYLIYCIFGL